MKRTRFIMSILLIAAGFLAGSCAKPAPQETPSDKPDPGQEQTVTPVVSISADATFNEEQEAA